MLGEIDKQLMIKFLERNYPVSRVKDKMRFRRGVILDDGSIYLLGDSSQRKSLYYKLVETIMVVFYCDESTSKAVLNNFMQLK